MTTATVQAGYTYTNGKNQRIVIMSSPNSVSDWYKDQFGYNYRPDGTLVQIAGGDTSFDLDLTTAAM